MKVLYLSNYGDYDALEFMERHNGILVKDIIENLSVYEDEDSFELTVYEFDELDLDFVKFIRNEIFDNDDQKHKHFWLETETIKW